MKKILFGLLMIVVLAMVSFPLLLAWQPLKYTEKSVSPNENYTVVVKHSDGQWPFGPAKVKVSAKKNWLVRKTYWTEIADDGGQGWIEISWSDEETAQIILHGDEQRDEIITVTFSGEGIQITTFREEVIPTPPPSEPTLTPEPSSLLHEPVNIEVDVGDGEHTFWVELTEAEVGKTVNIYREKGDPIPLQSFTDEEAILDLEMAGLTAEDVNFDGCMDFHYCTNTGYALVSHSSYYVWDPDTEQFQADPYGLNELSTAEFLSYSGEVSSLSQGPMGRLITSYQYEGDTLIRVGECFFPGADSTEKAYEARYVTVDDTHTFWVKLVDTGDFGSFEIQIFSEKDDAQPLQTLEGSCERDFQYLHWNVEDMDFDGHTDFGVLYADGSSGHALFSYYIWNEKELKFLPDPYGLNELFSVDVPEMFPEEKTIRTFLRWRAGSEGEARLYRYLEEGFTCIRYMSWQWHEETDEQVEGIDFFVENYEGGEMKTVYEETCPMESLNGYLWSEGFSVWFDPAYPGE